MTTIAEQVHAKFKMFTGELKNRNLATEADTASA